MKTIFGIFILFIEFIIPFKILICCYGKIVWMLSKRINTDMTEVKPQAKKYENKNSENAKDKTTGTDNARMKHLADMHKDKFQLARRNTIKTLILVGLCFIICWSQNEFFYLIYNFGYPLDFNSTYYHFTVLMVFLNCTVNPFTYLFKYQDYQIVLRQFCCKTEENNENQSQNSFSSGTNCTNI